MNPKSACKRDGEATNRNTSSLTESLELLLVASEPGGLPGSSLDAVGAVSPLSESASLASGARESSHFAVLVDGVDDPVDAWVVSDFLVAGKSIIVKRTTACIGITLRL